MGLRGDIAYVMGTGDKTLGFRPDSELREEIEDFKSRRDIDKTSQALEELVEVGVRETRGPILYRIKEQAIDAAFYLTLVAVVTVVIGFTTTALERGNSIEIAFVILAIGMMPIAIIELVRFGRGQSALQHRTRGDRE